MVLIGPNARHAGDTGGIEWRPPAGPVDLLLAGDETAVPAISAIAEALPAGATGRIVLEVPEAGDVLPLRAPAGMAVTWLPRRTRAGTRARGALLTAAVSGTVTGPVPDAPADDAGPGPLLWDVPPDGAVAALAERYVWLAGEATVVTGLRRRLLRDAGLDRASVAFMGYWKAGRASV